MSEEHPERRLLIAFGLVFLVVLAWPYYMRWRYPPPPPGEGPLVTEEQAQRDAPPETPAPGEPQTAAIAPPTVFESAPPQTAMAENQGVAEQFITVDSDVATITFSTQGAVIKSWQLKHHLDANGDPLELIHGGDTGLGFPLEFQLEDPALEARLNAAIFTSSAGNLPLLTMNAPGEVIFEWSSGNLAARKLIAFPNGYLTELETDVWVDGQPVPHRVRWGGGFGDLHASAAGFVPNFLLRRTDELQRVGIEAALETTGWIWKAAPQLPPFTGEAAYAGLEDRYFAVLFIPETPALSVVVDSGEWIPVETHNGNGSNTRTDITDGEEEEADGKPQRLGVIAVGSATNPQNRFRLFVGPKEIDALQKVSLEPLVLGQPIALEDEMVDFGWFWWVARPLLVAMQWIYTNLVGNYGWAIILLTFVINLVMFPLKYKSSQQAWRMQKVAPRMKALQAEMKKYKSTDPKRNQLQQEMMGLYKKEGVNPLGGCLPLLIQFPFFLGFYRLLYNTIELRHAPWIGWVQDLSLPDPYYILPIVMTGTMFLSTQMTPQTTADPAQQRMMKMMPLIFGVMFLTFPSGLVLYWFTSNVVGVGQQWWINKEHQRYLAAEKQTAKEHKKKKKQKGKQAS